MVVKKIAKTEKIISELTSVRKLTRPSLTTSGCTPHLLLVRSSCMGFPCGHAHTLASIRPAVRTLTPTVPAHTLSNDGQTNPCER